MKNVHFVTKKQNKKKKMVKICTFYTKNFCKKVSRKCTNFEQKLQFCTQKLTKMYIL